MANPNHKQPENVPGHWYVSDQCVICGMCPEYAPEIFGVSSDGDHAYVHHQPVTPEELAAAQEALESCPTDAIGKDGETVSPTKSDATPTHHV